MSEGFFIHGILNAAHESVQIDLGRRFLEALADFPAEYIADFLFERVEIGRFGFGFVSRA